eukprot:1111651-Prymnesium_polylepis.1
MAIDWDALAAAIASSSLLNIRPGSTIERDIRALVNFFNNTAAASQGSLQDPSNPYRGAFAQVSEWREQQGWSSIVTAHSSVAVRCKTLYMQDGEEFVKRCVPPPRMLSSPVARPGSSRPDLKSTAYARRHCFWSIDSLQATDGERIFIYPSPRWTIVEDCCEQLERPVLRVHDAVWATTRGVGRMWARPPTTAGAAIGGSDVADDFRYVPKLDCSEPLNAENIDCESPALTEPTRRLLNSAGGRVLRRVGVVICRSPSDVTDARTHGRLADQPLLVRRPAPPLQQPVGPGLRRGVQADWRAVQALLQRGTRNRRQRHHRPHRGRRLHVGLREGPVRLHAPRARVDCAVPQPFVDLGQRSHGRVRLQEHLLRRARHQPGGAQHVAAARARRHEHRLGARRRVLVTRRQPQARGLRGRQLRRDRAHRRRTGQRLEVGGPRNCRAARRDHRGERGQRGRQRLPDEPAPERRLLLEQSPRLLRRRRGVHLPLRAADAGAGGAGRERRLARDR